MSTVNYISSEVHKKVTCFSGNVIGKSCKWLFISGLFLYLVYIFLSSHPCCQSLAVAVNLNQKWRPYSTSKTISPTKIDHIVFGIVGSSNTWSYKRWYTQSWWKPNVTRGFLFLDRAPIEHLPWPPSYPSVRVSEDTSRFNEYNKHRMPFAIRMVRVILETFKAENKGVRWYVMADDDTVLIVENLVEVLSTYDHNKYFYIGMNSESILSNAYNSFGMAFGGAGYALSYPLAEALAKNLDECLKRYPTLYGSDHILQSCVADLGVSLTQEKGFHQIDLHRDISGLLSSHPQSPFLSLHHLDVVEPIFPKMNRYQAVNHLMEAAKVDSSRLLQQSVCYHKQNNWTFSLSWGYSTHIYEKLIPFSFLQRPLETFTQWRNGARPPYMFNTRWSFNDSCEAPHIFFFDSVEKIKGNYVVTSYVRSLPRSLPACSLSGNHSADYISKIYVFSPVRRLGGAGSRRECCNVIRVPKVNATAVKLRACMKDEIVA
ncbi:hypothetical protein RJ639_019076 [Escallonia herrerae]|uniref:Uncharacterized protein n=1 Tax=Escallonia herrerae TaxID=1293975 RepID=A0AA89AJ25_9ASTE|nr:hypothetical protein RJ639_025841 [Escallonia herrerae]KAK3003076.1 hypothetical protein RJ639_019076 [Escallonia herrerae]